MSILDTLLPIFSVIFGITTIFVGLIPLGQKLRKNLSNEVAKYKITPTKESSKNTLMDILFSIFDRTFALMTFFLLSPLIIAGYILLYIIYSENPIKKDRRVGYRQRNIVLYSFKTKQEFKHRPIVKFVTHTSIDQLPRYWNILNGDISLFGIPAYKEEWIDAFSPAQRAEYQIMLSIKKPGLSCLEYLCDDNNNPDFDYRLKCNHYFVDNDSISLRLKMMIITMSSTYFYK